MANSLSVLSCQSTVQDAALELRSMFDEFVFQAREGELEGEIVFHKRGLLMLNREGHPVSDFLGFHGLHTDHGILVTHHEEHPVGLGHQRAITGAKDGSRCHFHEKAAPQQRHRLEQITRRERLAEPAVRDIRTSPGQRT